MASTPKAYVMLIRTSEGWRPQSDHTCPPIQTEFGTLFCSLLAKGLSTKCAKQTARAYNRCHLGLNFQGLWAIAVASLKGRGYGTVASQRRQRHIGQLAARAPQLGGGI